MGAKLEIKIILNQKPEIEKLVTELNVTIDEQTSFKNWKIEENRELESLTEINAELDKNNIIYLYGSMKNYDFTVLISRLSEEGIYELSISTDTKYFKGLDDKSILRLKSKKHFFDFIITKLHQPHIFKDLIAAGIGVETYLNYNKNLMDMVRKSHHVYRWKLPDFARKDFLVNMGYTETSPNVWDKL